MVVPPHCATILIYGMARGAPDFGPIDHNRHPSRFSHASVQNCNESGAERICTHTLTHEFPILIIAHVCVGLAMAIFSSFGSFEDLTFI